jgi:uncharacterized protein (DUF433 family)
MNKVAADIRNQAAYGPAEAARYLRLPAATLRTWLVGRVYPKGDAHARFHPLIKPATMRPLQLSFYNLVEAHVLRALRTEHGVPLKELRQALEFAERELDIKRLLLRPDLRSRAGQVFLSRYGQLINLSASGQLAMRQVLEQHLDRVTWDRAKFPIRLYPFVMQDAPSENRPITIDPTIAFGRPVLSDLGISTAAIVARIDAGESTADLAADYQVDESAITHAIVYERAAFRALSISPPASR